MLPNSELYLSSVAARLLCHCLFLEAWTDHYLCPFWLLGWVSDWIVVSGELEEVIHTPCRPVPHYQSLSLTRLGGQEREWTHTSPKRLPCAGTVVKQWGPRTLSFVLSFRVYFFKPFKIITFLFNYCVQMCVPQSPRGAGGPLARTSLLLFRGSWASNSGHRAWRKAPLLDDPTWQSIYLFFLFCGGVVLFSIIVILCLSKTQSVAKSQWCNNGVCSNLKMIDSKEKSKISAVADSAQV